MERSPQRARPFVWAVLATILGVVLFPGVGLANPIQPASAADITATPAQIVVIDGKLNIEVLGVSGTTATNLWTSPSSESGWTNFATGDFNRDGDAEIVATKFDTYNNRGVITIYDPVVNGVQPVALGGVSPVLSWGQSFHWVVTGDFMGIGQDQIVAAYNDTSGAEHLVEYYPLNASATVWATQNLGNFSYFASPWDAVIAGDVNADGRAELVLARNVDKDLLVLTGQWGGPSGSVWSQLWEDKAFCSDCNWYSLAVGRVVNDSTIAGNQLIANRHSSSASRNSTLIFTWNGTDMVDITPGSDGNYYFAPNFTQLALAKLDGTASVYNEIVELRQVPVYYAPKAFMTMLNPAGASLPPFETTGDYDPNSWSQVAAGDLRGVGRDQVVVLRGDTLRIYFQPWVNTAFYPDIIVNFRPTNLAIARIGFANQGPVVTPTSITLWHETAGTGANDVLAKTISIQGPVSGAMSWTASILPSSSWLTLSQYSGTTSTTPNLITATGVPSQVGNAVGVYNATVEIDPSPYRSDWVRSVSVRMVITPHIRYAYLPIIGR